MIIQGGFMREIWTEFTRYNTEYRISSFGKIMRKEDDGYKEIPTFIDDSGQRVAIFRRINGNGLRTAELVAMLVAKYFVPNPHNYKHISFTDDDPLNCKANNLRWIRQTDKQKAQYRSFRKMVNQYTQEGKYIRNHTSLSDAADFMRDNGEAPKASAPAISNACKTGKPLYGYQWRFESAIKKGLDISPYHEKEKPVYQMYDKKTFICLKEFKNLREAADYLGKETSDIQANIDNCCKGKRPTAYGYIWKLSEKGVKK